MVEQRGQLVKTFASKNGYLFVILGINLVRKYLPHIVLWPAEMICELHMPHPDTDIHTHAHA